MEKKIKFPKWSDKFALYNWVTRKLDEGCTFENDREVNDFLEEILKSIGVIPNFTKIQTQKEAKNIIEKSSLAIEEMKKKIDTSNASIKKLEERIDFETRRIDTARNLLNAKTTEERFK